MHACVPYLPDCIVVRYKKPPKANNKSTQMGHKEEQLYDDEIMSLMSAAYEAADKEMGSADKALQVTMAVAVIRAINEGERDVERLTALAIASVRGGRGEDEKPDEKRLQRPGLVSLSGLLG